MSATRAGRGCRPDGSVSARAVSADLALKKGRTKAPKNTQLKPTKDNTFRPFREESEFLKICNEQMHLFAAMVLSLTAPMAPRAAFSTRSSLIRMDDIRQTRVSNVVESNRPDFQCSFEIPKKGIAEYGECQMKFKPLLATGSECVVVRYDLPFGLAAEPRGRVVVVTKDGPGGEKVGDILRFTTQWTDRQPGMFDVCKCMERQLQNSFDQVVNALVSNDGTYGQDIVLVFERPME